ncbi:hypothetical protein BDR22DRAFT_892826 [Usnea florida]
MTTQCTATTPSSKKRKTTAPATPASTPPESNKRIKTERVSPAEPRIAKPKATNSIYDSIIEFKIGKDLTSFGIHKEKLRRAASIFFKGILSRMKMTEKDQTTHTISIILEDEHPDVFRRFVSWLYDQSIVLGSEAYKDVPWGVIIDLYSFADRNSIRGLQNTCVDTIIKKRLKGGLFPAQADLNRLWKLTGDVFRLRRLLLDLFAAQCNLASAIAVNGSYHPKFLQGLVLTMYNLKTEGTIYKEVDFWQKRQDYYVDDRDNPIVLD